VLATEPPPLGHPLVGLDNVIISPHLAALDEQAVEDMATGAARNIVDIFAGNWPLAALINPAVKSVWKA
jgi:D-3-phosphoglycerate dehydrogenase